MQEQLEKLGIVAGAILALIALFASIRRGIVNVYEFFSMWFKMPRRIERIMSIVDERVAISELRHKMLLQCLGLAFWQSDTTGRVTEVSPALVELMGAPVHQIMAFGWESSIHPEDREDVKELWLSAVESKSDFYSIHRFIRRDGSTVKVRATAAPALNGMGDVAAFIGHVTRLEEQGA